MGKTGHRQTVFVEERFADYVRLTNGVLLSTVDLDLALYLYNSTDQDGYNRLKGKLGDWSQFTFLHKIVARRMELDSSLPVDHINNSKRDNRRENLQAITTRTNLTKDKKGSSKYYRVSWHSSRNKWRVAFSVDKKIEDFGHYTDKVEAAYWADVYAIRFTSGPLLLNFPANINLYYEEALLLESTRPWKRDHPTLENLYESAQKAI